MPRELSLSRPLAQSRPLAGKRRLIGPSDHNKLWVVLDTGILISALISSKNKHTDGAPYKIIKLFRQRDFYLITTSAILKEYSDLLNKKINENNVNASEVSSLLNDIISIGYAVRVFVDKPVRADKGNDDLMFDYSHAPDFIVTMDKRLKSEISKSIFKTAPLVLPGDFLRKITK